ncbi:MAG: type VII toxin-antitoxin system HepT family RNase toxin [Nitrososphaerales archaeon]
MRIRNQLDLLKKYFSEFLDYHRRESIYAVERLAQLVIQSILDLGALILVYSNLPKPESYRGIIRLLAERAGINELNLKFLEGLAGFRNILVHTYANIDRELEERAFSGMIEKLPSIIEALENYVKSIDIDPIEPEIKAKLSIVLKKHGVKFAIIFGSTTRREGGKDYDIAVSVNVSNALDLGRLLVDISEALGVHEERIDLVHLDTAPLNIIYTILLEGILIYGDQEEAYDFLYRKYLEILDSTALTTHF